MELDLAPSTAGLAVVTPAAPHADAKASAVLSGDSFSQLAGTLDVVSIAPPPPVEGASDVPEPGTWSLLVAGLVVVALFGARRRR